MAQKTASLLPSTDALLRQFGERLRLARQRRRLSAKQVAERAGMSPMTLRSLERGGSGVTMGAYLAVMQVIGVEADLDLLAKADPLGRTLQDVRLSGANNVVSKARTESTSKPAIRPATPPLVPAPRLPGTRPPSAKQSVPVTKRAEADWVTQSGFASSDALAGLIDAPTPPPKKRR